ncbi:arginine--tRNA ligase [Gangjinia marincola]|uniref:Arginine--tRNA ligase n=1 Tax=Gangjinia marincola TaxID=578463 RepID=A0ABN1MK43_9FLAO
MIQSDLVSCVQQGLKKLHQVDVEQIELQPTRKEFDGDITVVVFPMLRHVKTNPVTLGNELGAYVLEHMDEVSGFNVIKGFLNLELTDQYYIDVLSKISGEEKYGIQQSYGSKEAVMVEYSSPNTNKPLHLGHIRNNLLGYAVAEIIKASGKNVYKTQIINDRGIHICKSMLAWKKFGNGETPQSTGMKGDHFVGKYYVKFDKEYKTEIQAMIADGIAEDEAKKKAPLLLEAQQMLLKWEAGEQETVALWKKMNGWVYGGFEETYKNLGVDFDSYYYESDTYLLGKDIIEEGLAKGVFFKKEDNSVWCDLTAEGLDEKLVLRSDGTAVYMTQDLGTAVQRVKDHPDINGMVYTVGNEQDYHFKVLFLILKKLGYSWADHLHHLSYGMVDLPSGKMKSREGTVVDADDLIKEMERTAEKISSELGKLDGYTLRQKQELYHVIGLGALKYYILKVDPKKTILFNPEESVDFQGNTGPFIQYTYARIQSILRKAKEQNIIQSTGQLDELHVKERDVIKQLEVFPDAVQQAAEQHSPAIIANYTYELVKSFNSFYQNVPILGTASPEESSFRVLLANKTAQVIKEALAMLGIEVPERM